ncbi:MAG: hypothetical protein ACLPX8_20835 [Bryobacteraceae bacterium]|jgi:uncharacterized protein (TIGR03437 family)
MKAAVCHKGTATVPVLVAAVLSWNGGIAHAQQPVEWRKVGGTSVALDLSGPATGAVARVWYGPNGATLYAETRAGKVFRSTDLETWSLAVAPAEPAPPAAAVVARLPESGSRAVSLASDPGAAFALGQQLYRSDDGGRSWTDLTGFKSSSVVGGGLHDIAVAAGLRDRIVVANDYGVWRSADGGLSWSGLNEGLPNLAVRRILATPTGTSGIRVEAEAFGTLELTPGAAVWHPVESAAGNSPAVLNARYARQLQADVTAVGVSGETVYAGTSEARIWVSLDGGRTFPNPPEQNGSGRVERIWVDSASPRVALAVVGGASPRVLRTTNSGGFWDSLDGDLPAGAAHGITADRAAGAVYVATDAGVFYGQADLENASVDPLQWRKLTGQLPSAPATDVRLDPAGVQLYAALDGYGVYAAAAPHRTRSPRIVNAADFSTRAAAPGSLLSVVGARVGSARGGEMDFPVLAASDNESQIQVPFEASGPSVALALDTNRGPVTMGLPVEAVSPAILLSREGAPAIFDADTEMPLDAGNPVHSQGRILIMATGLGRVQPNWPTGVPAPQQDPPAVVAPVTASLDGAPVAVTRATLAPGYVGFYQIEVQMPAVANAGTSELWIGAGGTESNRIQIVVAP